MDPIRQAQWARRLRPLHPGDGSMADQLRRRLGVVVVASALLLGLMGFFLAIFAGFGRWDIGLILDGAIVPVLGWFWWGHRRLRRVAADYQRELLRK